MRGERTRGTATGRCRRSPPRAVARSPDRPPRRRARSTARSARRRAGSSRRCPPPDMTATTIAPSPTSVASQPRTNRPGAARPSIVKVDVPDGRGCRGGTSSAGGRRRRMAGAVAIGVGRERRRAGRRVRRIGGLRHRSGSGSCAVDGRDWRDRRATATGRWMAAGIAAGRGRGAAIRPVGSFPDGSGSIDAGRDDLTSLEVLAAPRTQRPVEADQPRAVRADAVEPGPARRADDPFLVDPPLAGRAVVDRLDLVEQRLLGEVPLPHLADLLVRPDDLVDPDARGRTGTA